MSTYVYPKHWEQTILACLTQEPKDRPQNAGEVVVRLQLVPAERLGLGGMATHAKNQRSSVSPNRSLDEPFDASAPTRQVAYAPPKSKTPLIAALAAGVILLAGLVVHTTPASAGVTVTARQTARESLAPEKQPFPQSGQAFENSLGQKFVPVHGTVVLFCIWETRVQDFAAFVKATGHDATQGMYSDRGDGWRQQGDTWKSPGFPQSSTHPVVGVNEADAKAFCVWLTEKERGEGRLADSQEYRLPTDAEWDAAVGKDEFPWGLQWPPPRGAGNYADESAKRGRYKSWPIISGYDDGFDATSPVGSFHANWYGIYDLGGNVWERVGDRSSGLRGASFISSDRVILAPAIRLTYDNRNYYSGFRVVCAVGSAR